MSYNKIKWTHQIQLPTGVTPGEWAPCFEQYGLVNIDFKGKSVLDIGCLDGLYSFYAEEKGASSVLSLEINDTNEGQFGKEFNTANGNNTGYLFAHKALKSKAEYLFPYSVYDLDKQKLGTFDVVLCLGLIYHLAHPILALEKINQITKKNGSVIIETEVSPAFSQFYHKFQFTHPRIIDNSPSKKIRQSLWRHLLYHPNKPRLLKTFIKSRLQYYLWKIVSPFFDKGGDIYKNDVSNFFVMDDKTIERIIDFAGFRIEKKIPNPLSNRITYICKKMKEIDPYYAYNSFTNNKTTKKSKK